TRTLATMQSAESRYQAISFNQERGRAGSRLSINSRAALRHITWITAISLRVSASHGVPMFRAGSLGSFSAKAERPSFAEDMPLRITAEALASFAVSSHPTPASASTLIEIFQPATSDRFHSYCAIPRGLVR